MVKTRETKKNPRENVKAKERASETDAESLGGVLTALLDDGGNRSLLCAELLKEALEGKTGAAKNLYQLALEAEETARARESAAAPPSVRFLFSEEAEKYAE